MTSIGWVFETVKPGGSMELMRTATTGQVSFDLGRDVTRSVGGLTLLPADARRVDLVQDEVALFLVVDGVRYRMGRYAFTESVSQKDVVLDPERPNESHDIEHISLSDRSVKLIRNTGAPETINKGFDPSQEMQRILASSGLPYSVAGANSASIDSVTWDGNATDLTKVRELAELAGHRSPWMNNDGVIRSTAALVVETDIIELSDLKPVGGSIAITNTYLTAPNRVVVSDNSFAQYPIRGQWDAPGSAPHSVGRRGYVHTVIRDVQGLGSDAHADVVAATIGERLTARALDAEIIPTHILDGPAVIRYDGALWLLSSWSVSTASNSTMRISAEELLAP